MLTISNSVLSTTTISMQMANHWGREIILALYKKDIYEVRELLSKGANVNYIEPKYNNTPLHYVFLYNFCNSEIVRLLLNTGADPGIKNAKGLTAYSLAEERCSAIWPLLKSIFDSFISTTNPPEKLKSVPVDNLMLSTPLASSTNGTDLFNHETTLAASHQSYTGLGMLILPVSALANGSLALGMDKFADWSEQHAYYLSRVIRYGFKPMALAGVSASMNSIFLGSASSIGLEAEAGVWASFFAYAISNCCGLLLAQPIERVLTKKIQNKVFNILLPILLYSVFLNPSLFFSEGFLLKIIPMIMLSLMNGLLFKTGEWATQKTIDKIGNFFKEGVVAGHNEQLASITYTTSSIANNLPEQEQLLDSTNEHVNNNSRGSISNELRVGEIIKFRFDRVRKDSERLNDNLNQLEPLKELKILRKVLKEPLNNLENLATLKTYLSNFNAKNNDLAIKEIIVPFLNYITALQENWDKLCAPNFLTQYLTFAAENENARYDQGHLLLSETNFLTLRFDFLKLETFSFYLKADENSEYKVSFYLSESETDEKLKTCIRNALQAIKTILFDPKIKEIVGQVFFDKAPDLKNNCNYLAANLSVAVKSFETLKEVFCKINEANLRVPFLQLLENSIKLCKQRMGGVSAILNRLDLLSKGKQQGIGEAIQFFKVHGINIGQLDQNTGDVTLRNKP